MGGDKVDYGASVPISAESIRKAVSVLKQYNVMDAALSGVMSAYYSQAFLSKMDAWTVVCKDMDDHPDWIQKLEKEWGIR